jgi:hypothetical protein
MSECVASRSRTISVHPPSFGFDGGADRDRESEGWAWQQNPNGMFVDWNPKVSCEGVTNGAGHVSAS